ncbi:UNVERIFIED_CONTAM: hypothetical protein RMT77_002350 [Armadillidium vulgare]
MSKNQIAPGNHEKAWNDPPQLSFNTSSQSSSSNRIKMMKKRIPVPLNPSSNASPSSSQRLCSLPPKNNFPIDNVNQDQAKIASEENLSILTIEKIQEYLENLLSKFLESSSLSKTSTVEDVSKRINLFVDMWNKSQLHPEVKKRMSELVLALNDGDYNKAWSVHQSVIVDYTTDCSSWMSAIKTLITEGRKLEGNEDEEKNDKILSDLKSSSQMPLFLNSNQ